MKHKRPVNLDLRTIKLPLAAYVSILHRISGVILFLGIGFLLYLLSLSLQSEQTFMTVKTLFSSSLAKLITWAFLSALAYHLVMGIKHLLADVGIADDQKNGHLAAQIGLVVAIGCIVLLGVWIW